SRNCISSLSSSRAVFVAVRSGAPRLMMSARFQTLKCGRLMTFGEWNVEASTMLADQYQGIQLERCRGQKEAGLSAMFVSRLRLWRFLLPSLSHLSHHFFVLVGWQHAHQSHHAYNCARPTRREPVRLRLGDGLIHDHVHVLRIAGHSSPLRLVHGHHAVLMTTFRCLWRRCRRMASVRLPALLRLWPPDP